MLLEPRLHRLVDHAFNDGADFGGNQLVLRLRGEFRIGHLHRQHGGEALPAIVTGKRNLLLLGDTAGLGVAGDLPRHRAAKARQMGAAVALRDVVGEAQHVLVVAVVPPQCTLDADAVLLGADGDRRRHDAGLVAVEIFDERLDTAVVAHLFALLDRVALVGQDDADAGVEEGELAQAMLKRGEIELDHGEGLRRGQECHFRAALTARIADHGERCDRHAMRELHGVFLAVAPDAQRQLGRQRVDDGYADAVQAAGDLVGVLVEFSAGVQLGHDDLGRRDAFALVNVGRNTAAVVAHGHRAVGIEHHVDGCGVSRERLVDRVVDDLVDHVMQTRTVIGVADVHARPLADSVESLQDLDGFGVVSRRRSRHGVGDRLPGRFSHAKAFGRRTDRGADSGAQKHHFVP